MAGGLVALVFVRNVTRDANWEGWTTASTTRSGFKLLHVTAYASETSATIPTSFF